MPSVVAAITSIAGTIGATAIGSTTIGAFLTQNIFGRLLVSVAFSALKVALAGKPQSRQSGIRTKQTQTGGTTPASFVLGEYATEGQLMAPPMSHGNEGKTPNAYLTYVIELGDIPGQGLSGLILDGEQVEFGEEDHADYGTPILGRFTDHAWVKYYDGSQTEVDPMLLAKYADYPDRPWSADMVGTGICYAILTFRFNREIFSGFPKVRFEMVGIPLYDPRKDTTVGGSGSHRWADRSTWEPSENVAVQVYNILRGIDLGGGDIWGGSAEAEDLPLSVWWAAMNQSDLAVVLEGGGTEPQWRSSFEVFVNDEPAKVIEDLLRGCSGKVVENGGVWKIRLGGPGLPLYYFTDKDAILTEPAENIPFSANRQAYNGVQAVYPDPAALWEPKDAPALYNAAYELADGGQRRVADLSLNAAPYPTQVQRVMHAYAEDERRFGQHVLNLPPDASMLEPLDVAAWSSDENGYDAKSWDITSNVDPLTSGTPQFRMREVDPTDYDWQPSLEQPVNYANINRTPLAAQPVAGFGFRAVSSADADGNDRRPGLEFSYDGEGQDDVRGFMWEIRLTGTTDVILRGSTADVTPGFLRVFDGILPLTGYEGRGQWVVDRPTTWTDWESAFTGDYRLTAADMVDEFNERVDVAFERHDQALETVKSGTVFQLLYETRIKDAILAAQNVSDSAQQVIAFEEVGDAAAAIVEERDARVSETEALALNAIALEARVEENEAEITEVQAVKVDASGAVAAVETEISTKYAGMTAMANATSFAEAKISGIAAGYVWKLNGSNVLELVSVADGVGGPVQSTARIAADYVQITGLTQIDQAVINTLAADTGFVSHLEVDTVNVAGRSITVPYRTDGPPMQGNGTWLSAGSIPMYLKAGQEYYLLISWYFKQGYATTGPTWGYRLYVGGTLRDSAQNLTFGNDRVTGVFQTATEWLAPSGTGTRFRQVELDWYGSDGNITADPFFTVQVIYK